MRKNPFTIDVPSKRVLVLALAFLMVFVVLASADPSIDRRLRGQTEPPVAAVSAGSTQCGTAWLHRVAVSDTGNILYEVVGTRDFVVRLAGNINTPAGRAILQLLLTPPVGDKALRVWALYPAGYNCERTNYVIPAKSLEIGRTPKT